MRREMEASMITKARQEREEKERMRQGERKGISLWSQEWDRRNRRGDRASL